MRLPSTDTKIAKQTRVTTRLRQQIVTGDLPPGSRLPTRRELEVSFGLSPMTIQQALAKLVSDGFVEARGKLGTFVVDRPPHLSNIAVVFPILPGEENWTHFWSALANETMSLAKEQDRNISAVYGIDGHADNEDFQKLIRDVRAHRVAGLIFASNPFLVRNTPLLTEPDMAHVSVAAHNPQYPASPVVYLDSNGLVEQALSYFASKNRRNVAIIHNSSLGDVNEQQLQSALNKWGMVNPSYWRMGISLKGAKWARNAVNMMMRGPAGHRPDALLILDDNLVEYASFGLVDAGVRVPDDVEVIAHCNFPWPTPSVLPIRRLGFDARSVLRACIESIDSQREGRDVIQVISILAQFQEDLQTG